MDEMKHKRECPLYDQPIGLCGCQFIGVSEPKYSHERLRAMEADTLLEKFDDVCCALVTGRGNGPQEQLDVTYEDREMIKQEIRSRMVGK